MLVKTLFINDCDIVNYKEACMFIGAGYSCSRGCPNCQNEALKGTKPHLTRGERIVEDYMNLPITHAIVFGGLEPLEDLDNLTEWIRLFRDKTDDPIIIYSGDPPKSPRVINAVTRLKRYKNIIFKLGEYHMGQKPHYDELLGVKLASDNQHGYRLEDLT